MKNDTHIKLDDLALDWTRIEEWCSHISGRAIYGPVLKRVEAAGRALEAERNELVEQLETYEFALQRIADETRPDWLAARIARSVLNPASEPEGT